MKNALLVVVLLVVIGLVGFLYRSTLESPLHNTNAASSTTAAACPADAKVCPDGSAVGRSGPSCQFATCALPNIEIPEAGLAFVLPPTFSTDENAYGAEPTLIGAFVKSPVASGNGISDSIIVRRYAIPAGKDANSVMIAHTMYGASGMQPKSMDEFKPVIINGKTYQMVVIERFEAVVHVQYYLPRKHDVISFEAVQHNVMNWTDPGLNVRTLPVIAALETMLGTLQSNEPGN